MSFTGGKRKRNIHPFIKPDEDGIKHVENQIKLFHEDFINLVKNNRKNINIDEVKEADI